MTPSELQELSICCICGQPATGWKRRVRPVEVYGSEWLHWEYSGPIRPLCNEHFYLDHDRINVLVSDGNLAKGLDSLEPVKSS